MFVDHHSRVFRDISCNFLRTLFINKAAKTTHINIITFCHRILNDGKEGFYRYLDICLVDSCLLRYFRYYVRFRHLDMFL